MKNAILFIFLGAVVAMFPALAFSQCNGVNQGTFHYRSAGLGIFRPTVEFTIPFGGGDRSRQGQPPIIINNDDDDDYYFPAPVPDPRSPEAGPPAPANFLRSAPATIRKVLPPIIRKSLPLIPTTIASARIRAAFAAESRARKAKAKAWLSTAKPVHSPFRTYQVSSSRKPHKVQRVRRYPNGVVVTYYSQ